MIQPIYSYPLTTITGTLLDLSLYQGKKLLLVNTASACGYTPQYAQLEQLWQAHRDQLVVIGIPCNDFGAQEPGSEAEIATFCEREYGVTFPMTAKVNILTPPIAPIYQYLTTLSLNGHSDNVVKWNFQKYLINTSGFLQHIFPTATEVTSEEFLTILRS